MGKDGKKVGNCINIERKEELITNTYVNIDIDIYIYILSGLIKRRIYISIYMEGDSTRRR